MAKPDPLSWDCPKCGYDLRETPAVTCPECGADVSLELYKLANRRPKQVVEVLTPFVFIVWIGAFELSGASKGSPAWTFHIHQWPLWLMLLGSIVGIVAGVWFRRRISLWPPHRCRRISYLGLGLFLLFGVLVIVL